MGMPLDSRAALARLLQRTGFGATTEQVDAAASAGFDATVSALLAPPGADRGAAATPPPRFTLPERPRRKGDQDARKQYLRELRAQSQQLGTWWLDRMVAVEHQWTEKRTLLWHGHWATSVQKVKVAGAMLQQNETMRRLGGGDFGAFSRAMVRDPALMIWLDASGNTAQAPNENLARELMELFTLGVGNYSENDVRQAARALTGWRVDRPGASGTGSGTFSASFDEDQHATGTQTILGVTRDFSDAELVDLFVATPASARYLVKRMWGWLVSATPPSQGSLDRIVAAYQPQRDLTAMFHTMLTDPAFRDSANVLVKQPVEYVVGAMRALRIRPAKLAEAGGDKTARRTDSDSKNRRGPLAGMLQGLGQVPFAPPNVGGWPSGNAWLTTSAARTRLVLAGALARAADLSEVSGTTAKNRPELLAKRLGLSGWSARTADALAGAADNPALVTTLALTAPEYLTSR